MQQDLNRVIEQVSKEKGIDKSILINALENAMISAAKRPSVISGRSRPNSILRSARSSSLRPRLSWKTVQDPAVEVTLQEAREGLDPDAEIGDELLQTGLEYVRPYRRTSGQTKYCPTRSGCRAGNYLQRVQGAEGQLVNGIVQRFEKRNIIVNLGRTDAILPEKEQVPRERYRQGDRIRAYIVSVEITSRGPQIVLSRTHPACSQNFRAGSSEIYEGIVELKARRVSRADGPRSPSCP